MTKYTGITIGPIISTLSMARKPRELWSASYLFSLLMEKLIKEAQKNKFEILSPAQEVTDSSVGLFPDRLFCKLAPNQNIQSIIDSVKVEYTKETGINTDYFNIWIANTEAINDGEAINKLNKQLDILELQSIALNNEEEKEIRDLIIQKESLLFKKAFGTKYFKTETLAEIASVQLRQADSSKYKICADTNERHEKIDDGDDILIKLLRKNFPEFKTPHKFICIVHADGDNIGTIINSLSGQDIKELSSCLLTFGSTACSIIKEHKGLPIYAGGDDLLFIAPVLSNFGEEKDQTIFDLIQKIDKAFVDSGICKFCTKDEKNRELHPSMSYGVSITYHKYPLYEALSLSRDLLFKKAKKVANKNAIAWKLQKGSGSTVSGKFSKSNNELTTAFFELIKSIDATSLDGNMVSAVAHKLKSSETLLSFFMNTDHEAERLNAFFNVTLEYENKNIAEKAYLDAVRTLLSTVYKTNNNKVDLENKDTKKEDVNREALENIYGMLRTAKFIKGLEEDKDE